MLHHDTRMKPFGKTSEGQPTQLFTLQNANGLLAEISDFGGTLVRLLAPDRHGRFADVVLGCDSTEGYAAQTAYLGALIGRYGNRIAHGRFSLDGRGFNLATNNRPGGIPCHLHGGWRGFDKIVWGVEPTQGVAARDTLRLHLRSPDGNEGFPGNLDVTVVYSLTPDNALRIDYHATTDRATPVNLTNHTYFNLAGHAAGDVLSHELTLHASHFTPVDAGLIPLGAVASVAGTPFDFRTPRAIGERIDSDDAQLRHGGGYDHNFVLTRSDAAPALAATVFEPSSGRVMEVFTTEPGVQFYSGNFLDGSFAGKTGVRYPRRGGFCLETQHFPDSPNQPTFPSTILRPGQALRSTTIYRFSAR